MPTQISTIVTKARKRLIEPTASFWSDDELRDICIDGIRDLWRDIVDLKQEHYLVTNTTDVTFPAGSSVLQGVPTDVHKLYMIEPVDPTANSANVGLNFVPLDYNHKDFIRARTLDAIEPTNSSIWYSIRGAGAPVGAPEIRCAPQVNSAVAIAFTYVPTLGPMTENSPVPIPGEADNALVAWTVAYARAKEKEDRAPDQGWLGIYATEKQHLLQTLGLREYQEPSVATALFEEYWG
jgi:hypothetical protein